MTIEIVDYDPAWPREFETIAARIRDACGEFIETVEHIGSTAVPGLAAKDVIDVQFEVRDFQEGLAVRLAALGYRRLEAIVADHVPPQAEGSANSSITASDWAKWFFRGPKNERSINLHVRIAGRANARYAVLFRDYLRRHPVAATAYAQVKRELARLHADDIEAYYDVKDPVCDLIWIAAQGWEPQVRGIEDCAHGASNTGP